MGCCLSRNKNQYPNEEMEEVEIPVNSNLKRYIKETDGVLEGPQMGVPSRRNNNSIIEDYMPEINPILEESFKNKRKTTFKNRLDTNELNISKDIYNVSKFYEVENEDYEFKNNKNNIKNLNSIIKRSISTNINQDLIDLNPEWKNNDYIIYLKIQSFELTFSDFFDKFRIKLEPVLNVYFEDLFHEIQYSSFSNENLNESTSNPKTALSVSSINKVKSKKYTFQENEITIKLRCVININSFIIISILNKKENDLEKVPCVIGEGQLPLNLVLDKLKNGSEDFILQVPIINIVENTVLGTLYIELSTSYNSKDEDLNERSFLKQKNKLDNYFIYRILKYTNIDIKLRKRYFKDISLNEISSKEELESEKRIIDTLKNLIFSGRFSEVKKELTDSENKLNEIKFYHLFYILNEIIENDQYKKIDPNFFEESYLYQFLEKKNDKVKNIILIEIQIKFLIKVKEKKLLSMENKYQFINIEKIINSIKKDIYPYIINSYLYFYENVEKEEYKSKKNEIRVNFSDPELVYIKSNLYRILYLLRITLKDEIEFERKEKDKSKMRIYENNIKFIERDVNCFRMIFKDFFLIQNEILLKDCNIALGITKCLLTYLKMSKKFSLIRNYSKTLLILETFLDENSELLHWLLKLYSIYITNKKFYLDFLEISNELLEDSFGIFIINYMNVFNVKFIIKSFTPYSTKISSDSFKNWYYYLSILSKISSLIRRVKDTHIDFLSLSNTDSKYLVDELKNVFSIFENGQYFNISQDSLAKKLTDQESKNMKNLKFFEMPLCIQIQLKSIEILKNLSKNDYLMKCFLVDDKSVKNNAEIIKKIFNRIINLLYYDSAKIKLEQNLKLYDKIIHNIIFIFYFLMNEIEIYTIFLKNVLPDLIKIDFNKLIQKLIEEIEILKEINKENPKQYLKFEEISKDILKINSLYLYY